MHLITVLLTQLLGVHMKPVAALQTNRPQLSKWLKRKLDDNDCLDDDNNNNNNNNNNCNEDNNNNNPPEDLYECPTLKVCSIFLTLSFTDL